MSDLGGVWRTVGGRRIFIKDGEDLATAMKNSGKFKKENNKTTQNEISKKESEINKIQNEINDLEEKTFFGSTNEKDEKLEKLFNERTKLQKEKLDLMAKENKNIIQDKELRDFIYDYTNGDYRIACEYTQKLANGLSEKEAFKYTNAHANSGFNKISNDEFSKRIELSQKLSKEIEKNNIDNKLIRFEKTQVDENYNDLSRKYKIGEEIDWGIKSTSSNEDYFNKVIRGEDKIEGNSLSSAYPFTYTEYQIVGEKNGLNISEYSQYKDQDEVLVKGKFKVENVENFSPEIVYDEKQISFKDYIKDNNYTYEIRTSKKGKEMIDIYDENKKIIEEKPTSAFVNSADGYKYGEEYTLDDVLNGKIAYKIEKIENKEKSTYGVKRQIVTLRQIK